MQLSIQDLIASVGQSVSEAQQTIEIQSIQRFLDFFETDMHTSATNNANDTDTATVSLKPRTIKMSLPSSDDLSKSCDVNIPLPALAHHRQVHLDKVTVKVRTRLTPDDNGNMMADIGAPVSSECSNPGSSDSDDEYGEINLVFNVSDSSEGVSRVVQNITKTI